MNSPSRIFFTLRRLLTRACLVLVVCLSLPVMASAQIENGEFDSLTGWNPWGSTNLSISSDSYQGGNACLVENRTQHWQGIAQSLHGDFEPGKDYHVTSYVKLHGSTDKCIQIEIKQTDDRGVRYFKIGEVQANDSEWTLLEAGFNFQSNGPTTELQFIFNASERSDGDWEFDFLVDSVDVAENDWKPAANARIEQFRKRDAQLTFVTPDGREPFGLEVDVQQVRHHFGFGSSLSHDIAYNPIYADFFQQHFNRATVEYFTQWRATEETRGIEDYRIPDISIDFAQANGIKVKGHALAYPLRPFLPDWLLELPPSAVQAELEERVTNITTRYDGQLIGWDVSNEMLEDDWLAETLGGSYRAWMFQRARELSPDAVLSTNEYGMEESTLKTQRYRKLIEDLLAAGADVGEIGLQSHFFHGFVSPKAMEIAVSELAELDIDLYFTEFDITNEDPVERGKGLENFYRYAFSRPEANGITMWGFWAGAHWRGPNAALVDIDWTINAAGQKYFELMDEWTTSFSQNAQSDGTIEFRGFHGDYLVTTFDPENSVTNYHLVFLPKGTNTLSQELQVNPIDNILMIYGTNEDDLFEYDFEHPERFFLNSEKVMIDVPVTPSVIRFVGGDGNDKLETISEQKNQHFVFSGQRLSVVGESTIEFPEIESVEAIARTLGSTVTFRDTAGDDLFSSFYDVSTMTTSDTEITAENFRYVFARATKGGSDSALLFGSSVLQDRFHSDSNVLSLKSGSRNRRVIGFGQTFAYSDGGTDRATIDLTNSPNSLAVFPTEVSHETDGKSLELFDFPNVEVNGAANNTDSISFNGNDSDQTLRIYSDSLVFYAAGFRTTINDINQSSYNSSANGSLRLVIQDTSGNDTLDVTESTATYSNSGVLHTVTGPNSILAYSRNGGTDSATISDSAPPTILVGEW